MYKKIISFLVIIFLSLQTYSQIIKSDISTEVVSSDYSIDLKRKIDHYSNDLQNKQNTSIVKKNLIDKSYENSIMGDYEFDIKNTAINSNKNEYGSGFFKNRFIIVSSKKIGVIGGKKNRKTGEHHTQLFCATVQKNGDLKKMVLYSRILNTKQNEGSITFSPDNKTIYFTRNNFKENENFQIYKATDKTGNGQWLNEEELSFSSNNYSVEDVFLSQDGKKLYFSSNMPGGFGGYDLYMIKVKDDNTYSQPENLGKGINTVKNERYPFIDTENKNIYFSSNAYNTIGGLDIYKSRITKKGYSKIINLGPNINSTSNDYAFVILNNNYGYYSSDKQGGIGGSDVYNIQLKNTTKQIIKGNVRDAKTKEIVPNSAVKLIDIDGEIVSEIITDENGAFNFKATPFEEYTLSTTHKDYEDNSVNRKIISANEVEYYTSININKKEIIKEIKSISENVFFTFNSHKISNESGKAIRAILKKLERPVKKITIIGHTDYFGNKEFNYKLGLQRAENVLNILNEDTNLKSKSVVTSEGENKPIIKCDNCSINKVKQNRRVEISIEY